MVCSMERFTFLLLGFRLKLAIQTNVGRILDKPVNNDAFTCSVAFTKVQPILSLIAKYNLKLTSTDFTNKIFQKKQQLRFINKT